MVGMILLRRKIICCGPMLEYHPTGTSKMSIYHRRAARALLPHFWSTHRTQLLMIISLDFQVGIRTEVKIMIVSTWIMEGIVRFELIISLREGGANEMNP